MKLMKKEAAPKAAPKEKLNRNKQKTKPFEK
jgi:hypothetical protein